MKKAKKNSENKETVGSIGTSSISSHTCIIRVTHEGKRVIFKDSLKNAKIESDTRRWEKTFRLKDK